MKRRALALVITLLALPAVAAAQAEDPPEAAEAADAEAADADAGTSLDSLRKEYLRLRDKLFRSRARAAAVGDALYSTKLSIYLHWGSARFYNISRATIRLDGSNIFDDAQGTIASDEAPRFEGFVAPGRHVISVRLETEGKEDDRFTSTIESSFTIQAPGGKNVKIDVRAKDDGNIPYQWKKNETGSYKLRLDAKISTKDRKKPGKGKKKQKRAQNKSK